MSLASRLCPSVTPVAWYRRLVLFFFPEAAHLWAGGVGPAVLCAAALRAPRANLPQRDRLRHWRRRRPRLLQH